MPGPDGQDRRSLYLIALAVCLALAGLGGRIMQVELARDSGEKARAMTAWADVWGERYDPALPAWAYSERQRSRWGLSLAGAPEIDSGSSGGTQAAALRWTRESEQRAFAEPSQLREISVPALGLSDRCISCHQFSAKAALPDPLLVLADSPRQGDQKALLAARKEAAQAADTDTSGIIDVSAHPGSWLEWHDPQRFGCTSCHGGTGSGKSLAASGHRGYIPPPGARRANPHLDSTTLIRTAAELWASCGRCHPGDYVPANPLLSEGRQLARWLNCAGCHDTGPNLAAQPPARDRQGRVRAGRAGLPAPPLGKVAQRLGEARLADYPNRAHVYVPEGRMPQYALRTEELSAISAYLRQATSFVPAPESRAGGDAAAGARLAEAAKCLGCHYSPSGAVGFAPGHLPGLQGVGRGPGPPLAGAVKGMRPDALERILAAPAQEFPGTRMPDFRLTAAQRADLAAWLLGLAGGAVEAADAAAADTALETPSSSGSLAERGRDLLQTQGCIGCHAIPGVERPGSLPGPSLRNIGAKPLEALPLEAQPDGVAYSSSLYQYFVRQLETPEIFSSTPAAMPHFALSARERALLAVALLAEQAPPSEEYICLPPEAAPRPDYWPWPLPPQGAGPEWLSPLERSLDSRACAQCHPRQYSEWAGSRHAKAMGPGITGQIIEWARSRPADFFDCLRCHARLSEQLPLLRRGTARKAVSQAAASTGPSRQQPCSAGSEPQSSARYEQNPSFVPGLAAQAHGCANCHVRAHVRFGTDKPRQDYLWNAETLSAHPLVRFDFLRDSALCKDCHQFDPGQRTVNGGPPLQNTYEEWRSWAAVAAEPRSCQDCHMPQGAHGFEGIHSPDFVKESVEVSTEIAFQGDRITGALTLHNTGNGHHLPTYVTPRIWLQAWLSDAAGSYIQGSWRELMIGRDARAETAGGRTRWRDHSDTRIPAGGQASLQFDLALPAMAQSLHLEVYCAPDHFYHQAYGRWLREANRSPVTKQLLREALAETAPSASGYYIYKEAVIIPSSGSH